MLYYYLWCALYVCCAAYAAFGLIVVYEDVVMDRMAFYKRSRWRDYYRHPFRSMLKNLTMPAVLIIVATFSLAMGETYRADPMLTWYERIGGSLIWAWFWARLLQSAYMYFGTAHARRHAT